MHISYSQYDMLLMSISVSSYMFICQLSHSLSSLKINRFYICAVRKLFSQSWDNWAHSFRVDSNNFMDSEYSIIEAIG